MNLIHLEDLYYRYTGAAQPACRDITLSLKSGQIIGLLGENGAGKSTLAALISGQLKAQKGQITGRAVHSVGLVHQKPEKIAGLPLWKALMTGQLQGPNPLFSPRRIINMLEEQKKRWDIPLDLYRDHGSLNQAESQQAELLEILLKDPQLILLDEPDFSSPRELRRQLDPLLKAGKTLLLITHQWQEAEEICDQLIYLREGSVVDKPITESILPLDENTPSLKPDSQALLNLSEICSSNYNLQIHKGEILVVLGFKESGLLQLENRLHQFIHSQNRPFAYIPSDSQSRAAGQDLSLKRNILLRHHAFERGWRNRKEEMKQAETFLKEGGWPYSPHEPLYRLSGGNRQKLMLRREASQKADLMLAVHPALGLDRRNHQAYLRQLKQMDQKGVIYLTSDPREAMEIASTLAIYFRGEVIRLLHPPFPDEEILQQIMMGAHR